MRPDVPDDNKVISDDLYREIILDHYRAPRHRGMIEPADARAEGVNPLCGDQVVLTLALKDGRIDKVGIEGKGCAISQASTSMMAEVIHGEGLESAERFARMFKDVMLEGSDPEGFPEAMEDLKSLENVKRYPVRIKCAILAWNTLLQAIKEAKNGGV